MKKIASKDLPSNLKTSRQNVDEIGRTSQGAPQKFTKREKKFIDEAKKRKTKKNKYTLKEAMGKLAGNDSYGDYDGD